MEYLLLHRIIENPRTLFSRYFPFLYIYQFGDYFPSFWMLEIFLLFGCLRFTFSNVITLEYFQSSWISLVMQHVLLLTGHDTMLLYRQNVVTSVSLHYFLALDYVDVKLLFMCRLLFCHTSTSSCFKNCLTQLFRSQRPTTYLIYCSICCRVLGGYVNGF